MLSRARQNTLARSRREQSVSRISRSVAGPARAGNGSTLAQETSPGPSPALRAERNFRETMSRHHYLGLLSLGLVHAGCSGSGTEGAVGSLVTSVHESYPHARDAFTQGLVYQDSWIYESTGLEGRSSLRRVEVETGRVDESVSLAGDVFGEGLAAVGERLVQLTWQSQRAFVYELESLQLERELGYQGEGWGLCYDGE